jgi:tRNA(Ile)-lysidine synthase TilS/MesJ
MRYCNKCIIPESAKGIKLNSDGFCQLCNDYKKNISFGIEKLNNDIKDYIDNRSDYNCIVPVSGGRDSSYALYYAKKILGLKPIAVHSDNDFETDIAKKNLINITKSMDTPLKCVRSKNEIIKKIVSEKFKMNAPFGPDLVVDQTCEACKYGFESATYNAARKNKIKVIFWGDSAAESTVSFHNLFQHQHPTKMQRLLRKEAVNYLKYKYYFSILKKVYGSDSPGDLKEIHLYDYVEWDREIIVDTIQNKMGWTKPETSATSWRIDCKLVPVVNYLTKKAFGVSKIELGFSAMIRSGKMDRETALDQVQKINEEMNIDEIRKFLRTLSIPEKHIAMVM